MSNMLRVEFTFRVIDRHRENSGFLRDRRICQTGIILSDPVYNDWMW